MPKATRKINVAAKPAAKPAKPAATKPAVVTTAPAPAPAPAVAAPEAADKPIRGLAATARTVAANATNFGNLSDRDNAYIAFYARLAKRTGGRVTLRDIATADIKPDYAGSAKPHDAGVINRLRKAGLLTIEADGTSFAFTNAAHTLKPYADGQRLG